MRPTFLLLLAGLLQGQEAIPNAAEPPQFQLLLTSKTSTLEKEIQQSAAAGYRLVLGGRTKRGEHAALMQRRLPGEAPREYRLLATDLTSTMQKEITAAGEQGFRAVEGGLIGGPSEVIFLLERVAGAAPERPYLLLATNTTSTLQKELKEASAKGFRIVGMLCRREHLVLLQQSEATAVPPRDLHLLAAKKTSTMQKELNEAMGKGYRLLAGSTTYGTEVSMLLEKPPAAESRPIATLLSTHKVSTLEKELNARSIEGFRLLPRTVSCKQGGGGGWGFGLPGGMGEIATSQLVPDEVVAVMEKKPSAQDAFDYRVLGKFNAGALQQELAKLSESGYRPVAMAGCSEGSEAALGVGSSLFVVLERPARPKPPS